MSSKKLFGKIRQSKMRTKRPKAKASTWDKDIKERAPMLSYACQQVLLESATHILTEEEWVYCVSLLEEMGERIAQILGTK